MSKITPFLWFDTEAEEAASFYTSVFPNSTIVTTTHYGLGGPALRKRRVMMVAFEAPTQNLVYALNGGLNFPASARRLSFVITAARTRPRSTATGRSSGGRRRRGGPVRYYLAQATSFGVSWQVCPTTPEAPQPSRIPE